MSFAVWYLYCNAFSAVGASDVVFLARRAPLSVAHKQLSRINLCVYSSLCYTNEHVRNKSSVTSDKVSSLHCISYMEFPFSTYLNSLPLLGSINWTKSGNLKVKPAPRQCNYRLKEFRLWVFTRCFKALRLRQESVAYQMCNTSS